MGAQPISGVLGHERQVATDFPDRESRWWLGRPMDGVVGWAHVSDETRR